jgi:hypothetical protein
MVGSGTDTYDPICELPAGHEPPCRSSAAIDQHKLTDTRKSDTDRKADELLRHEWTTEEWEALPEAPPLVPRKSDTEWLWWCGSCGKYTERVPCEHCGVSAEEIIVLPPGTMAPALENVEALLCDGALLSVDSYDWPEEAYVQ